MSFSSCPSGKRQYHGRDEAQLTLDRLVERWNSGTINDPCFAKRAYPCPDCGCYHLTKQDPRRYNPADVYPTLKINIGGVR